MNETEISTTTLEKSNKNEQIQKKIKRKPEEGIRMKLYMALRDALEL